MLASNAAVLVDYTSSDGEHRVGRVIFTTDTHTTVERVNDYRIRDEIPNGSIKLHYR